MHCSTKDLSLVKSSKMFKKLSKVINMSNNRQIMRSHLIFRERGFSIQAKGKFWTKSTIRWCMQNSWIFHNPIIVSTYCGHILITKTKYNGVSRDFPCKNRSIDLNHAHFLSGRLCNAIDFLHAIIGFYWEFKWSTLHHIEICNQKIIAYGFI